MAVALWLAIKALLWYCLLELPPFKSLPAVPVGVAGIFANFYLIQLTRRVGARSPRRVGASGILYDPQVALCNAFFAFIVGGGGEQNDSCRAWKDYCGR